jgi:hypothetical protein
MMRGVSIAVFAVVSGLSLMGTASAASLTGSSVSGQMLILNGPPNYFDPANGFVPSGYGNSAPNGPNNITIGSGIEFGYQDGANTDTVDFGSTNVTLQDVDNSNSVAVTFVFTDSLFVGATLTAGADNFPDGVTAGISGQTLTISMAGFTGPGTFDATFNFGPVSQTPLPAALPLFAGGLGLIGLIGARKRRKTLVA